MQIAHLLRREGDPTGFANLRAAFESRNPGYRIDWRPGMTSLQPTAGTRVAFVHRGAAPARVGGEHSELVVGDVVMLRAGEELIADAPLDTLVFTVPAAPDPRIPTFLRPDHDPRIGDSPGGCAEEADAYRRVILTWREDNGPFTFHGLNTHRVRMVDSFSHYHPHDGGFDEMYLVQQVRPGARLFTTTDARRLEDIDALRRADLVDLVIAVPLQAGDLVWIGRGDMHRAVGGVTAHVITVPGFLPGREIGVDHHIRSINERFGLRDERALPCNVAASFGPVVK